MGWGDGVNARIILGILTHCPGEVYGLATLVQRVTVALVPGLTIAPEPPITLQGLKELEDMLS